MAEHLEVPAVAGPEDVAPGLIERTGDPGSPPFTRGIHPEMYRVRPWVVRQLAGYGTATDTNERFRFLLDRGATGINCVFDYPTLRAFDSDDHRAEPDVGRGGVAVDVLDDVEDLFSAIPIADISISLVSSQPIGAVPHLAMFLAIARRRGIGWDRLRGTSQNDFLMETCVTVGPGTLPPAASFQLECDLAEFCIDRAPRWNPVSVAAYNYREAGADAVLEVALAMAHALAVADELVRRGIDPDRAAGSVTFFFSAHLNLFQEVAKFRAARRIWHRLATEQIGCRNPRSTRLRFHAQTAGTSFSASTPLMNIGRGAIEALAAVAGGAQSLHVNAYDEAFTIPTQQSAALALQTHQILLQETGVADAADPLGGSYLVEHLTDQMESKVQEMLGTIGEIGGIVRAVETGWLHRELGRRAFADHRSTGGRAGGEADRAEPDHDTGPIDIFAIPGDTRAVQRTRLQRTRAIRDSAQAERCLKTLDSCALDGRAVSASIDAVEAGVTIGEIGAVLRGAFGTWTAPVL